MLYEIYGKSGGCKFLKLTTEAIVDACREEMVGEGHIPPCTLELVKGMIDDDLWEDFGQRVDWRGGVPEESTCKTRAGAKATRIGGVLANTWGHPMLQKIRVCKDDDIITHLVPEVTLSDDVDIQQRCYVKALPSLKKAFRRGSH